MFLADACGSSSADDEALITHALQLPPPHLTPTRASLRNPAASAFALITAIRSPRHLPYLLAAPSKACKLQKKFHAAHCPTSHIFVSSEGAWKCTALYVEDQGQRKVSLLEVSLRDPRKARETYTSYIILHPHLSVKRLFLLPDHNADHL